MNSQPFSVLFKPLFQLALHLACFDDLCVVYVVSVVFLKLKKMDEFLVLRSKILLLKSLLV